MPSSSTTAWKIGPGCWNPSTRYRWLLSGNSGRYAWVNGLGMRPHDVADADDFLITHDPGGPSWHLASVVYEIFPDRFASSGLDVEPPAWAVARPWDALPVGRGPQTPFEWFGGDLRGLEQRLDHIEPLGANALYLRPFFPARSTHRYDAVSFDRVDSLLGGNDAFASLVWSARSRSLRLIGDLTTNHTGSEHDWFSSEHDRRVDARTPLVVRARQLRLRAFPHRRGNARATARRRRIADSDLIVRSRSSAWAPGACMRRATAT